MVRSYRRARRRVDTAKPGSGRSGGTTEPQQRWEWHVEIPYIGPVGWPLTGSLSNLITVSALAAFEVIPVPVAGLLAVGHIMARNRRQPGRERDRRGP